MFLLTEIIGIDKIQNSYIDKILMSTKFSHRQKFSGQQNSRVDKNLTFKKVLCQQKSCADKMWAQARKNVLTVWLGRVYSSWFLPDIADDLQRLPEGVDSKCGVASGHPAFMGVLSPVPYRLVVPARHAENVTNFGADKISASAKISLILAKL